MCQKKSQVNSKHYYSHKAMEAERSGKELIGRLSFRLHALADACTGFCYLG